jgi:hypothetical protein
MTNGLIAFPVHSWADPKIDTNKLLGVDQNCPLVSKQRKYATDAINQEVKTSQIFQDMLAAVIAKYQLKDSDFAFYKDISDLTKCYYIADQMIMDFQNLPTDQLVVKSTEDLYKQVENCYALPMYGQFNDKITQKLVVSPVMDLVRNSFKAKSEGDAKMNKKYIHLSAHDSTLAPYYLLMDKANVDCIKKDLMEGTRTATCTSYPPTASSMVWELIKKIDGQDFYGVKFSINGEYLDFCKLGKKDKSGDFYCPLSEFSAAIDRNYYYPGYTETCGW